MFDLIANAKNNIDDPLMLEWALRYYDNLPENNLEEKKRIELTWFHDHFIAQLIHRNETETLSRLFNTLPAGHFSLLTNLIIKHWPDWPAALANDAIPILAINAPEALQNMLDDFLNQNTHLDFKRILNIKVLAEIGIDASWQPILNRLIQNVLILPEKKFDSIFFLSSLLHISNGLTFDTLKSVLVAALSNIDGNQKIDILKSLFQGLFGKIEFLELVIDRSTHESEQRIKPLAHLFFEEFPATQFDQWLDSPPPFASVIPTLEERSIQSNSCKTLLKLLKELIQVDQILSDDIGSQLAVAACIQSYVRDTFDKLELDLFETAALLAADFFKPSWYFALLTHLQSFDRNDIATTLIPHMPSVSHTYGGVQLATAMGDLAWPEFVPCLIDSIAKDKADYLSEAALIALKKIGKPAQTALIEHWDDLDSSQRIYGLAVISDTGGQVAADFAYDRLNSLMVDDVESCCALILAAPDQRLLDLLKPELRRKQPLIDRACYILALLLNQNDDEILAAKHRALKHLKKTEARMKAFNSGDLSRDSLALELRCPTCQAINQYEVKGVIASTEQNESTTYVINDEFPCASCGQDVEFELTSLALLTLSVEMLLSTTAQKIDQERNPLIFSLDCQLDGQTIPVAVALKKLRERASQTPSEPITWFQLGNLLTYINRPKASVRALSRALELAPNMVDIKITLAQVYASNNDEEKAFQLLSDALDHVTDWQFLAPQQNFRQVFTELYNQLRRNLCKNDLPLLHPSLIKSSQKIGRNDPCPCGSGKKFKKCCGR